MTTKTYHFDCRLFTGYKPCRYKRPCEGCDHYDPIKTRVAIVSLEAMGAVLRSTCLLEPIKRKFPKAHITWFTYPNAKALLEHNPLIDRVIGVDGKNHALLQHLEFDVVFAVDKSLEAGALAEMLHAKEKFGFGLTGSGIIKPLNPEASYQYDVGLDDELKFFINQKPETQQITESMALTWERDPYVLNLSQSERDKVQELRRSLPQSSLVIGYNTGCSILYPFKKFTVERSIELIAMWRAEFPTATVLLLGGPEDTERQEQMKAAFLDDPMVVNTPTRGVLRSGIVWMEAADLVLSGCSLGMHIAIGLKKPVISWFGVSCAQEIDLYDRGVKLKAQVQCSPCWKKSCDNEPKCFNRVELGDIKNATKDLVNEFSLGR